MKKLSSTVLYVLLTTVLAMANTANDKTEKTIVTIIGLNVTHYATYNTGEASLPINEATKVSGDTFTVTWPIGEHENQNPYLRIWIGGDQYQVFTFGPVARCERATLLRTGSSGNEKLLTVKCSGGEYDYGPNPMR